MCTVTWWRDADADAYGVWFNRDERRSRAASEPVRLQTADDGTPFLAPHDPVAGGTWLLANAHGLVVGVLNLYAANAAPVPASARSRDTLPLLAASSRSVAEFDRTVGTLDHREFAPFLLVAWDRANASVWSWDGFQLVPERAPVAPLTTSSHRPAEVGAWRHARYAQLVAQPSPQTLSAYHDDTAHAEPAFNIRMRRPDARTESVCRVTVTPTEVRFWHRREVADTLAAIDTTEVMTARV